MKHNVENPSLCEAFQYATNYNKFLDALNDGNLIQKYLEGENLTKQNINNARSTAKKRLRNEYVPNWLETKSSSSSNSRQKVIHKEVEKYHQFESYLGTFTNAVHRIGLTKLRLWVYALRIQT